MARRRRRSASRKLVREHAASKQKPSEEPEAIPIGPPADSQSDPEGAPEPELVEVPGLDAQPRAEPKAAADSEPQAAATTEGGPGPEPEPEPQQEAAPARAAPRGSSHEMKASRGSSSRLAARTSGRSSARTGTRTSGRQRAEVQKSRNYAPFIIAAVVAALVAAALSYGPMVKRTHLRAVASGGKLGYEAAHAMPGFGHKVIPALCGIVEGSSGKGRLAAAAALARIARTGGGRETAEYAEVVGAIRARLKRDLSTDARAAYAAALSQAGGSGIELVAPLVTDPNVSVRRCAVGGLAYGRRTPAAASALGVALGDEDAELREFAFDTLLVWAEKDSNLVLRAVDAAIALEHSRAHAGAARLLATVAEPAGDERLKAFLADESPEVRAHALQAAKRSTSADPEIHGKLAEIIASPAESVEVKEAALDAARALRAGPAGEAALAVLKSRGTSARLRAKAAGAVAATCPEGAVEALLGILKDAGAPKGLRLGVVDAFSSAGRIEGKTQLRVARALVKIAEGPDETMAGAALLALRSVSGMGGARDGPAQWRGWLERREYEAELIEKAYLVLKKVKAEYAEHGDPDRAIQSELFNKVGTLLNRAYDDADQRDKDALQAAISAIVRYKKSLR